MHKIIFTILCSFFISHAVAQHVTDTFHLYFDLNINTINKNTERRIDLLVYNDKIINGSGIMVIGYADYLGTEGYNKNLSMQRAKNVKDYLVKNGINAADIKMCVGKGQIERRGFTDKEGYPTDRRVDIVVDNSVDRTKQSATTSSSRSIASNKSKKDTSSFTGSKSTSEIKELPKLLEGQTILLKNVYFPPGRHIIKPESFPTLEKLYATLAQNKTLRISIEGHVCCVHDVPDALDNDTGEPLLSFNRAKSIYQYLVEKGIDPARLEYRGFGKTRPVVAYEQTEEDAERNRRVEIRILSK